MKSLILLVSCLILGLDSTAHTEHEVEGAKMIVPVSPVITRATSLNEALRLLPISVDDTVRVVSTKESKTLGIAGLVGRVTEAPAQKFRVFVADQEREIEVPGRLVELVSLAPGSTLTVDGREWISTEDGGWQELCGDDMHQRPHLIYP